MCDETEDHKELWKGFDSSFGGVEKWIEDKCKDMTSGAWEKIPRNFKNETYDNRIGEQFIYWNEVASFIDMMDDCDGGISGVYQREMKRKEKKLKVGMCKYFTISPSGKNQKDMTEEKLTTFGRRIKKYYNEFEGVLEFGKNKNKPQLHLHYLGVIRDNSHHKDRLKDEWEKVFPGNKALYNNTTVLRKDKNGKDVYDKEYFMSIHTEDDKMIPYVDWLAEKKLYFVNESKGSHENFKNSIVL